MSIPHRDQLLLQRFLDHRLDPGERAAFAARLDAEPALRQAHTDARALRDGFRAAAGASRSPSAAFTANVLAKARQLPSRVALEQADVAAGGVAMIRRLLLAAVVLVGVGFVWQSGLGRDGESPFLQAVPAADEQRELDRLDELLRSGAVRPREAAGVGTERK
jgi:anti-sigma factor RsiW